MKSILKYLPLFACMANTNIYAQEAIDASVIKPHPLGFLLMRVYDPANNDVSKVPLPTLVFKKDGKVIKEVRPCATFLEKAAQITRSTISGQQPDCAWATVSSTSSLPYLNIALPDTNAHYWATTYMPDDSIDSIELKGKYPNALYFSFNSYDLTGSSFELDGFKSSIPDFEVVPNSGELNPWQQHGLSGGNYSINVVKNMSLSLPNKLPMAPNKSGTLLDIVKKMPNIERCPEAKPCYSQQFFRPAPGLASGAFPNADAAYLLSMLPAPSLDDIYVIRGKLPTFTVGDTPTPWPSDKQLRYISICSNLLTKPYPVVRFDGCIKDDQLHLDKYGYYTVVLSHVKPILHNHDWLPFSRYPTAVDHAILLRNMVPNADFNQSTTKVTPDGNPATAKAQMGAYYPEIKRCSRLNYAFKGANCQAL